MTTGRRFTVVALVTMDPETPHRMDAASRDVVRSAASMIDPTLGRLVLLMTPPVPARDILWSDSFPLRILTEHRHRVLAARRALLDEANALWPRIEKTVRVATAPLPDAIARCARAVDANLVVVSDRRLGLVGRWLTGPSLSAIVRRSPAPVLVVSASAPVPESEPSAQKVAA